MMNNKKIKRIFTKLHKKLGRPMLNFEIISAQLDLSMLETQYNQLEKENAELKSKNETLDCEIEDEKSNITFLHKQYDNEVESLKNQLQAKDKVLDKAIKKITLDNDEGTQFLDSQYEYWKEWCEREID